jgi:hypothetical protein
MIIKNVYCLFAAFYIFILFYTNNQRLNKISTTFRNMKCFLTKIAAITLAFVVVFSTSSFTIDMHFCCNKLVDMAILSKAKTCKVKKQVSDTSAKECSLGQKDCCSNATYVKNKVDNAKKAQLEFSTDHIVFLQTFFYTYLNLFEGLEQKVVPFLDYHPPFIEKDIIVLQETFLL